MRINSIKYFSQHCKVSFTTLAGHVFPGQLSKNVQKFFERAHSFTKIPQDQF